MEKLKQVDEEIKQKELELRDLNKKVKDTKLELSKASYRLIILEDSIAKSEMATTEKSKQKRMNTYIKRMTNNLGEHWQDIWKTSRNMKFFNQQNIEELQHQIDYLEFAIKDMKKLKQTMLPPIEGENLIKL